MDHDVLTIQPFTTGQLDTAMDLLSFVFGEGFDDVDREAERSVIEPPRSQAAFDSGEMVGCLGTYSFSMSVPGGSLPCAGTTWVGVAPTHRRRGVLRRLMTAHLAEARDHGDPIAALWASEASIYGRFGYGMAAEQHSIDVEVDGGLVWEDSAPPPAEAVRIVPLDKAADVVDPIYEAARRRRPGMHARTRDWWGFRVLSTRKEALEGTAWKRVAVARVDGRDAGYAVYGVSESTSDRGRPASTLKVIELAGVDAAAEAAVWRYLLAHDLIGRVRSSRRPVDDNLPLLLTDSRRVKRTVFDSLYVRIVDLPAALTGRAYADSVGVTVEVTDEMLPDNEGTWRVEVAPEGAVVEPTSDAPDLVTDIRSLGSLYLGGMSLGRLAAAGRVEVRNPDVVAPLDAAFRSAEAPWAPEIW